jgi:hypothetical protein
MEDLVGHSHGRVNIVLDRITYKRLHELCWGRVKDERSGTLKRDVIKDAIDKLYEEELG